MAAPNRGQLKETTWRLDTMNGRLLRGIAVCLLILLPVILYQIYRIATSPPGRITFATGSEGGRYFELGQSLSREIEARLGIEVEIVSTAGSLSNLDLVDRGMATFGLYQQGTRDLWMDLPEDQRPPLPDSKRVRFVANLYSEDLLLVVRRDSGIESVFDLRGKRVSLGSKTSGDSAVARIVLRHYGLGQEDFEPLEYSYGELFEEFQRDQLDAAFIAIGETAPVISRLLSMEKVDLKTIGHADALQRKYPFFSVNKLPRGLFSVSPHVIPDEVQETVAVGALLITSEDASTSLVTSVTRIILDKGFQKQCRLAELFNGEKNFARKNPDFPVHQGAIHEYEPGLRPILNPDFVEATEGMRSFIVSILIAVFLLFRWIKRYRITSREHRLDRYIRSLLAIERKQISLDRNLSPSEVAELERLLDDVTELRQEALSEFTAHELREDRGTECFVIMCHALSDKIGGKLLRHHVDRLRIQKARPS